MSLERIAISDYAARLYNHFRAFDDNLFKRYEEELTLEGFESFLKEHVNRSFDVYDLEDQKQPIEDVYVRAEATISGKERLWARSYIDKKVRQQLGGYWEVFDSFTTPEANGRMPYRKPEYWREIPAPNPSKTVNIWDGDTTVIESPACINQNENDPQLIAGKCVTRDADSDSFESNELTHHPARLTESELKEYKDEKGDLFVKAELKLCADDTCLYEMTIRNGKVDEQAKDMIKPFMDASLDYIPRGERRAILKDPAIIAPFRVGVVFRGKIASIFRREVELMEVGRPTRSWNTFSYTCWKEGCTDRDATSQTRAQHVGKFGREVFLFHRTYQNGDVYGDRFLADFIRDRLPGVMAVDSVHTVKVADGDREVSRRLTMKQFYDMTIKEVERYWTAAEGKLRGQGVKDEDIKRLRGLAFAIFKPWENFSKERCQKMSKKWYELSTSSEWSPRDRFPANINLVKKYLGIDLPHPWFPSTNYPMVKRLLREARAEGNGIWDSSVKYHELVHQSLKQGLDKGKLKYFEEGVE